MSHSIVIVGAGAAGLMAACKLSEQGHQVTVVEARDRIGGRIHTLQEGFSSPVEAGAEFIHGELPLTQQLLTKAGAAATPMSGRPYQVYNGEISQEEPFDSQWNMLMAALAGLQSDTDIATFLNEHFPREQYEDLHHTVFGFVEGYDAADAHKASAFALRGEWSESEEATQYHIPGGYVRIIRYLFDEITKAGGKIILSSPVKEVRWATGRATVITTRDLTLEAEKVIVTIPLGVLQHGDIRFVPAIKNLAAVNDIGFGGIVKFLFEFKHAFWEDHAARKMKKAGFIFSDAFVPTWWTQLPDKMPLLTGWLGGPKTSSISHRQEDLFEEALKSLAYIFNYPEKNIRDEIRAWHIADWVTDPYSRGAYGYAMVKTPEARVRLSTPIADTIYFAGEALYEGTAMGTVEAALTSGETVAKQINGNQA